jgi:hypothetical protein
MSFLFNSLAPVGYGAIMYNGSATGISSCYPFFTSRSDFLVLPSISGAGTAGTINIGDVDEYWTVMPGYKVLVYSDNNYGGTLLLTGDNTSGTVPVNYLSPSTNSASSIKLFFKGTLIQEPDKVTIFSVLLFNGSTVTVPNYATKYGLVSGSTYYHVYEFYANSYATLSFTGSSTVSNILCLLIGGGGGGGSSNSSINAGAAGGGAGAFVTCTITAVPGSNFEISVGAGGTGGNASTTDGRGGVGGYSIIARTLNGVTDNTLTVAGGGGGGGSGYSVGTSGFYGSTGGNYGSSTPTMPAVVAAIAADSYMVTNASVFTSISSSVFAGGQATYNGGGGGGGGAGAVGGNGGVATAGFATTEGAGGLGGAGKTWTVISGTRFFAGGGGGNNQRNSNGTTRAGGSSIGGSGGIGGSGTANTGSGGGANWTNGTGSGAYPGGAGGSGICIIAIPI